MTEPRHEMDSLLDTLLGFAKQQLESHGEFFPFAASVDAAGSIGMVAVDLGDEHPQSPDVIGALYDTLSRAAVDGGIRAAGVCVDVQVTPPGSSGATDAIQTSIEHVDSDPVEVFLPYAKKRLRGYEYGELFAQSGTPRVFVS